MKAIEFETIITNQTIKIPDIYTEWSEKPVKARVGCISEAPYTI